MNNETEYRQAIAAALGAEVTDDVWKFLDNKGYVRRLREGTLFPEGVAEEVRQYSEMFGGKRRVPVAQVAELVPNEARKERGGEAMDSTRREVLSRLLAEKAQEMESVKQFRERFLASATIALDDVESWIVEQSKKDGPPTWYSRVELPADHRINSVAGWNGLGGLEKPPNNLLMVDRFPNFLQYGIGGDTVVQQVAVSKDGVLGQLREISLDLAGRNTWTPAQATLFVLTGRTPLIRVASSSVQEVWTRTALTRITLTLDPTLSPREVAGIYAKLRREIMGGKRYRPLSKKHIQLGSFLLLSVSPGETVRHALVRWNKKYPKWRYKATNQFKRDAETAAGRLVNPFPRIAIGVHVHAEASPKPEKKGKK